MLQIQYIGQLREVLLQRPGRRPVAARPFEPILVAESEQEAGTPRFVPLKTAQRYVEQGGGVWAWAGAVPEEVIPARILSGPIPKEFPYSRPLRKSGVGRLEQLPQEERKLQKVLALAPGVPRRLGKVDGGVRKAANDIMDRMDEMINADLIEAHERGLEIFDGPPIQLEPEPLLGMEV